MEKSYGAVKGGSSRWRPYRSEEFGEQDVWNVISESQEIGFGNGESKGAMTTPLSISRRLPSASRMIPVARKQQQNVTDEPKVMQHSAPVSVPCWSKMYGKNPRRKSNGTSTSSCDRPDLDNQDEDFADMYEGHANESDEDGGDYGGGDDDDDDDEEEEEEGGIKMPPHEWLARKLARNQISSFSVCEGAGRTLKGRDLSRVRNAVLSKTGFI